MKDYKQRIYSRYYTNHTKDLYGEKTLNQIKSQFPVYEYYFGKHMPTKLAANIIDLGCGSGDFVYWLRTKGYENVKGIDISAELINIGTSLGINNIMCNDIFNYLAEKKVKYDLMIMRDVLEHFDREEIYNLIKLLYDNLVENGIVIIQVPNGQSPFLGKILFGDFTHQNAYTDSSINQIFKSVGFNNIEVFEATPVPKNFKGKIRLAAWKLLRNYFRTTQMIATGDNTGYFTQNIIAVIRK